MKLKDKSFIILAIFVLLIGAVSAQDENDTVAIENTDLSVSDTLETISVNDNVENTSIENNFEVVETNNLDNESGEVSSVATPTAQTFEAIKTVISSTSAGGTITLSGTYTGSGSQITVNKNLNFVGINQATLDAKTLSIIIVIPQGYTVTFTNITFKNGKNSGQGGAVSVTGKGYFTDCNFIGNTATSNGGVVYMRYGPVYFTNCNFIDNTAFNGGAVYLQNGNGYFTDCNFTGNTASSGGGAVYISITGIGNFTNCKFTDIESDKNKEVIYVGGSGSQLGLNGNSIVTNSIPIYLDIGGGVTTSTVLVVLNNQTVKSQPNTQIDLTAVLYDDNGNIIGTYVQITLNVAGSSLSASFNRDNLNYGVSYTTPTVGGVYPVGGTYSTSQVKYGTLVTSITTLSIDLTVNNTNPVVDDLIQYTITIKNTGAYTANSINVEDILDTSKLEYVSCSISGEYNPNNGIWSVENLASNQESSLNIIVKVKSSGEINNIATVTSQQIMDDITKNVKIVASKKNINMDVELLKTTPNNVTVKVTVPSDVKGDITININGTVQTKTIVNGTIVMEFSNIKIGTYNMNITCGGSDKYNSLTVFKELVVRNDLNLSDIQTKILNNTYDNVTVKVSVPQGATGNITIQVNSQNYTGKIENGTTTIKLFDIPAGNYTANVIYSGDENYNPISKNMDLEVVKANINSSNIKSEILNNTYRNTTVKVTVPQTATGNITINVNGKDYNGTIKDGSVVIKLSDVPAGNHTMNIVYSGDSNYNPTSIEEKLEVCKSEINPSNMIVDILNNTYGNTTIKITVPKDATGNITINVNNKTYNRTIENGSAIIKITDLPVGNYTMNVTYIGDNNYNNLTKQLDLEVVKTTLNNSTMIVDILNNTYHNVTVKVTVPKDATGNITINVNNTDYNGTIENGSAIIKMPDLHVGDYKMNVTYTGDSNYNGLTTIEDLKVRLNLKPDDIKTEILNNTYGNTTVKITVPYNVTGNVTITVNNKTYNATIDNGLAIVKLTDVPVGNYTIGMNVTYNGDDNYNPLTKEENLEIIKANSNLKADILNNTYTNTTIKVTVPKDATGNITIKVANKLFNGTIANGSAIIKLENITVGNYTMEIAYGGDNNYNPNSMEKELEIVKGDMDVNNILVDVINNTYGNTTVKITVPTDATGNVTITVGDKNYTGNISNGSAIIKLPDVPVGNHTINITYGGDDNYNPITKEDKLEIIKSDLNSSNIKTEILNNTYGNTTVKVTLPTDATGNVTIKVGNKTYNGTIENGSAIIKLPDVPVGNHTMNVTYDGDNNYNPISAEEQLEIVKSSLNSSNMIVDVLNNTYQNTTVKVTLPKDATGNVTIKVNGNEYKGNISNGSAIIKLPDVPVGNHTMNVTYNGDNNYNPISREVDLEVVKFKLNPGDVKVEIINNTAGNITIKVTVPENETGNVTIKIGDKIYNGTVENGSAIIKIPGVNSGNYTGNVTFEGDNYDPISQEIELEIIKDKINLPIEAVDIAYGETEKVIAWLPEDANGYIVFDVNGTKHTVYINQIFATDIGDKQYSSTFSGLKVGEYTATVTYSGDSKYETITNSTQFKVVKGNLGDDLKVEIINDTVGNVTLNITVPGDATGNITIKIGNETYNGTIENGSAIVKLPDTPVGNHTIEIIYPGDDNYNPINETMNITVDKININPDDIKTEVLNNTYGNVTIKVLVPENATGNITVTINNQTYTGIIDNGSAIIKLENAIAGNNTAIITYSGDENYNPVTKEEIIEVVKKRLNPDDINVTIGNNTYGNVTVNVTVPGDATGNITITIGNETYIAPIVNGSAIIELPDVPAGDHNMTIKYPGDDNYEEITIDKNITINKNTLNPDDIKVTIENNTEGNVVIKVTAPEGVTGNITLVIDGKQYTMELVNGTATFIITDIPAGIYNIQVIYSGDNYEGFTKNLTLEIIAKSTNSQTTSNTIHNNENVDNSNISNGISDSDSLENIKTSNPILLLLLVLLAIPLRRKEE